MSRRKLRRLFRALGELGPMTSHDHKNGYANCQACIIGHRFAPHFNDCDCGHCPDLNTARATVMQDLRNRDALSEHEPRETL